jgi:hypothetical protein
MTTDFARRSTRVIEFFMTKEGIEISYSFNFEPRVIEFNPLQSAKALCEVSINIEEVEVVDGVVMVQVTDEDINGNSRTAYIEWDQYVEDYAFTQYYAILVAAQHELNKYYDKLFARVFPSVSPIKHII